jgi:hypothetical protein
VFVNRPAKAVDGRINECKEPLQQSMHVFRVEICIPESFAIRLCNGSDISTKLVLRLLTRFNISELGSKRG